MSRTIDPPAATHRDRLYLAAHGLAAPFACGGTLTSPQPLSLRFGDGSRFVARPPSDQGLWSSQWLDPLLQRCERAPFGHKRATRYDHRVRDALQLRAERGALAVLDFDPATNGILDAVRAALTPDDPNPLTAELHCLNVYATGGHFVPHKDTPRGADVLGTLVVCLPVHFGGGDLVLTHHGATKTFSSASGPHPTDLSWAAYFGDVDHEVQRVVSGHRITLSWLLRRGSGLPRSLHGSPRRDPFVEALTGALADPGFLPNGGTLGFRCEHQYSETPVVRRAIPALDARSMLALKGRDQLVAAAALAAGLEVTLKPFVVEQDIESALPVESHVEPVAQDDHIRWVEPPSREHPRRRAGQTAHGATEHGATGYFGGEGSDAGFYLSAALLVTVPSRGKRLAPATPKPSAPAPTAVKTKAPAAKVTVVATVVATAKPTAAKVPAAKVPAAKVPAAKVPAAKVPAAKAQPPSGEFMASELRAMGYGPAALKKALADGSIERASFGWYRIVRVPTAGDIG